MPLPSHIISVSAFLCERVLTEADGVMSAIRIVDLFYVRDLPADQKGQALPQIRFYACVFFKSKPGKYPHSVQTKLQQVDGTVQLLGEESVVMESKSGAEELPGGVTIQVELNIAVSQLGTCYLCLYLDGDEVVRIPFSVLPEQSKSQN